MLGTNPTAPKGPPSESAGRAPGLARTQPRAPTGARRGPAGFSGEAAERLKAAVLKTVDSQGSGGSNPSLSATQQQEKLCVIDFYAGVSLSARQSPPLGDTGLAIIRSRIVRLKYVRPPRPVHQGDTGFAIIQPQQPPRWRRGWVVRSIAIIHEPARRLIAHSPVRSR